MNLAAATARSLWSLVSVPSALGAHSSDHESFSDDADANSSSSSSGDGNSSPRPDSPDASRYSAYYWNDRTAPSSPVLDSATTTRIATSLMRVDEEDDQGRDAEIGISDIVTWFFPSLAPDAPIDSARGDDRSSSSPPSSHDPSNAASPRSPTPSAGSSPARQAALQALTRNYVARRPIAAASAVVDGKASGGTNPLASLASLVLGASALRAMGNSSVWSALVKRLKNKYWLIALAVAMAALPFMGLISYVISLHVQNLYDRHLRTEWHRLYSSITAGTLDSDEYDEDQDTTRHANSNEDKVDLVDSTRISRRTTRLHHHPPSSAHYSDGSHQRGPVDVRRSDPLPHRHDRIRQSGHRPLSSTSTTVSSAGLDRRTRGRPATRSSTYSQYTDEQPHLSSSPFYSPLADQYDSSNDDPDYPMSPPTTTASGTSHHQPIATSTIQPDDILQLTYELDHLRTLLAHEAAQEQMLRGEIATMREVLAGVLAQMRGLQEVQGRLLDAATYASTPGSRSPSKYGRRRRRLSLSPVPAPETDGRALSLSPIRRVPSGPRLNLLSVPLGAVDADHATLPPSLVISAATPPQLSPRNISPPPAPMPPRGPSAADALATALVARRRAVRSSLSKISDTQLKSYVVEAVLRGNCSNVRDVLEHVNERLESELPSEEEEEEEVECADTVRASGGQPEMESSAVDFNQDGEANAPAAAIAVGSEASSSASPPTPPMSPSPRDFLVDQPEIPLSPPNASSHLAETAPIPPSSSLLSVAPISTPSPPSPMPGSMPLSPPMVKEPLLPTPPASSSSSATSSPAPAPRTTPTINTVHAPTQQTSSSSSSSSSKRTRPTSKPFTLNPPARYRVVATPGRIPPPPTSMFSSPPLPDQDRPNPPAGRVSWHASSSSSKSSSSAATAIGTPSSPPTAPSLATAARAAARRKARSDIGPRLT